MKHKILSVLLVACLVLTLVPMAAFAEEDPYGTVTIGGIKRYENPRADEQWKAVGATWDPENATLTLKDANLTGLTQINLRDSSRTLTVKLEGKNTVHTESTDGFSIGANLKIEAAEGASLTFTTSHAYGRALYASGSIEIIGGTYDLTSKKETIDHNGGKLTISGGAKVTCKSTEKWAIYSNNGSVEITGEGTEVQVDALYNLIYIAEKGDITVSDGAKLSGTTSGNDHASIQTVDGDFTVTGSVLDVKNEGSNGMVLYTPGNVAISDSTVTLSSTSSYAIGAGKAITISGGSVTLNGGESGNAVWTDDTITISGGSVTANAGSVAIYSGKGVTVESGTVNATSTKDVAIFAKDGKIDIKGGTVQATSAEGYSPLLARTLTGKTEKPAEKPEDRITLGEGYNAEGNIVATTVWKTDGNGNYYADTMLVPADISLNEDGLLPDGYKATVNTVEIAKKVELDLTDKAEGSGLEITTSTTPDGEEEKTLTGADLVDPEKGQGATAEAVIDEFVKVAEGYTVQVINNEEEVLKTTDPVGTGSKVQLLKGNEVVEEITIIVKGDTDGDGKINNVDAQYILDQVIGDGALKDEFEVAAHMQGPETKLSHLDAQMILDLAANVAN